MLKAEAGPTICVHHKLWIRPAQITVIAANPFPAFPTLGNPLTLFCLQQQDAQRRQGERE